MGALLCVALTGLLVGGTAQAAAWPAADRLAVDQSEKEVRGAAHGRSTAPSFSVREVEVIRQYFAPRHRTLPPGLQKKLRRTGQLPPGWEKRFEPFPPELERALVVLPSGYRRGVIDGHAVIFSPRTQIVVDFAVLF